MIYIVIDNSSYETPAILGVFKDHKDTEDFLLALDESDAVDVVSWDIVRNVEVK